MFDLDKLAALDGLISPEVGSLLYDEAGLVQRDRAIVELGSYKGKSTAYLAAGALDNTEAPVFAVDAWSEEVSAWRNRVLERLPSATFREFDRQLTEAGVREHVTTIQSLTALAADFWEFNYAEKHAVGLLYIDGDHHYDAVLADYRAWHRFLAEDAVVIFDDYDTENNPGVLAAVTTLAENGEITNVAKRADRLAIANPGPKFGKRVPGVTK